MTQAFITPKRALKFIIFFGLISLFADVTYEGARSITGAFLASLSVSATVVGVIAGLGELAGYSLRLVSGFLTDRTQKYWFITIAGYAINLLAVPLLAFTNNWMIAAVLIIAERVGKAIRVPARDAMLSYAGQTVGMGFAFGLHEALDQFGAMLGPLIVALTLFFHEGYHVAFAVLGIPALIALSILNFLRYSYPNPRELEIKTQDLQTQHINTIFWLYLIGASLIAAGYADFALIAYHFQKTKLFTPVWIPITYAFAMGINSVFSLFLGHLYDRKGFSVLIVITVIATIFAPLVFLGNALLAFIGVALWVIGIGAQQSLMRAIIGKMIKSNQRASAYGIFNVGYGISWFLGSVCMGILYDYSIYFLIIFIIILQLLALPWLFIVRKKLRPA